MTRQQGATVRFACNCLAGSDGGRFRDSDGNGNTREIDPQALKTALARASGVRDTDESERVVKALKEARARGIRSEGIEAMTLGRAKDPSPEVWNMAPERCPVHNAPAVAGEAWDYEPEKAASGFTDRTPAARDLLLG